MKLIPLTQGLFAKVDDRDYAWLMRLKWCADRKGRTWYAVSHLAIGGKQVRIGMHQLLAGTFRRRDELVCDHINGDGLDNRRANLRRATPAQNMANQRKPRKGANRFKGVSFHKRDGKFCAYVGSKPQKHLGSFASEEEAARAYDRAARKAFGEFAKLNFPEAE